MQDLDALHCSSLSSVASSAALKIAFINQTATCYSLLRVPHYIPPSFFILSSSRAPKSTNTQSRVLASEGTGLVLGVVWTCWREKQEPQPRGWRQFEGKVASG